MSLQKCGLNLNRDRRELRPHGTPEFPCAGYLAYLTARAEDDIEWHWHEEIEVLYVERGSIQLSTPGSALLLECGDGAIISSNVLHSAHTESYCELHSIVFRKDILTGGDDTIFARRYIQPVLDCPALRCIRLVTEADLDVLSHMYAAFQSLRNGAVGHELMVRCYLSRMWLQFYLSHSNELVQQREHTSIAGADGERMRVMLDFIHRNYAEHIDLAQVSQEANIGPRECLRCFQRTIGISPVQYLLKYRVSEAAHLLQTTQLSVAEIAGQCGHDSPSNYTQTFKRFYAVTPKAYRQNSQVAASHSGIPLER